jgi:hypothetical protein
VKRELRTVVRAANTPPVFNLSLEKHTKKSKRGRQASITQDDSLSVSERGQFRLIPHLTEDFMRLAARWLLLLGAVAAATAQAQISHLKHVVVIFQENRTIFFKSYAPLPMEPVPYLRLFLRLTTFKPRIGRPRARRFSPPRLRWPTLSCVRKKARPVCYSPKSERNFSEVLRHPRRHRHCGQHPR